MAKNKVSEWSSTASSNADIGSINIAEGCPPSNINNAIRELMAQVKDFQQGADGDGLTVSTLVATTATLGSVTASSFGAITATSASISGALTTATANVTGTLTATTATITNVVGTSATLTNPLPISSGGTALTTLTAENVILGNGTSAPKFVAPGTSGNILTSNGTTWTSAVPAASGVTSFNTRTGAVTLSTADVLSASAGIAANDIGSYAWLGDTSTTTTTFGNTRAGTNLTPAGVGKVGNWNSATVGGIQASGVNSARSGTWRCMGDSRTFNVGGGCCTVSFEPATLWLRIS